jgi:hypothetical protein
MAIRVGFDDGDDAWAPGSGLGAPGQEFPKREEVALERFQVDAGNGASHHSVMGDS